MEKIRFEYELSCLESDANSIVVATGTIFIWFHLKRVLISCAPGDAVIHEIDANSLLKSKSYIGHTGWIYDIQFDDNKIVSAADDKTIKVLI